MLIRLLQSIFIHKNLEVDIDQALADELVNHSSRFSSCGSHIINFSLFELISSIGTIQTRIDNPSLRSKFDVNSDLFHWLEHCPEFKIRIAKNDSEAKKRVSEDFGIGLAAVVTAKLFGIKASTLTKISCYGKRPDFQCSTKNLNKFVVVEGKGTFYSATRVKQIKKALDQKVSKTADICVASSSLLKTNSISNMKYKDPSVIPPDDPEYLRRLLMTHHYSQAFNYIGQKDLSKYFSLMAKRIRYDKEFRDYKMKEKLFEEIKRDYLRINLGNYHFLGRLDLLDDEKYLFSGFDERLLWLAGFLDFEEYEDDLTFKIKDSIFNVSKDGICLGFVNNLHALPILLRQAINQQIKSGRVQHYQEYTIITDIDLMGEIAFSNFFAYVIKSLGFVYSQEHPARKQFRHDFYIKYKNKRIVVELKKSARHLSIKSIETLINRSKGLKLLLVTNGKVSGQVRDYIGRRNTTIIDRNDLKKIIKNKLYLVEILERI